MQYKERHSELEETIREKDKEFFQFVELIEREKEDSEKEIKDQEDLINNLEEEFKFQMQKMKK